jgi:signal transduction histidine kinase
VFDLDLVLAADGILMVCLLAAGYGQLDAANARHGHAFPNLTLLFLVATLIAPLLLRDRRPALALTFSIMSTLWTVGVARKVISPPFQAAGVVTLLYCLYTVAARYDRRVSGAAWLTCMGLGIVFYPRNMIGVVIIISAPVLVGLNVRSRRLARDELAQQEHRHQEERAVLEERQRIARELHDVVAHHMAVIAIHAEAAPYKVARPPEELTESFADIRASALEGLTELRRILGVLRTEADPQTAPQPGLERLHEVIASARGAGLNVRTSVRGESRVLPQGIGLSAYRIVQEALSNAMKHAPGAEVHVEVIFTPEVLRLRIVNGPGSEPSPIAGTGGGHGLVGMRERVAMLGGRLIAEPDRQGGFILDATLPFQPHPEQDP